MPHRREVAGRDEVHVDAELVAAGGAPGTRMLSRIAPPLTSPWRENAAAWTPGVAATRSSTWA